MSACLLTNFHLGQITGMLACHLADLAYTQLGQITCTSLLALWYMVCLLVDKHCSIGSNHWHDCSLFVDLLKIGKNHLLITGMGLFVDKHSIRSNHWHICWWTDNLVKSLVHHWPIATTSSFLVHPYHPLHPAWQCISSKIKQLSLYLVLVLPAARQGTKYYDGSMMYGATLLRQPPLAITGKNSFDNWPTIRCTQNFQIHNSYWQCYL